jgi:hypothetical protein
LRAHNGDIVGKATWSALVDESTWRAAQTVLNAPGRAPGSKTVRRHLLTSVLRCGKSECDGLLAGRWTREKTSTGSPAIAYLCKSYQGGVDPRQGCRAAALSCRVVSERLAVPHAVDLLKTEIDDEAIRTELETLYPELRNIGIERGKRLLTGEQAKFATDYFKEDIAKLERRQEDQERLRVFDGIPLGTDDVADAIKRVSPGRGPRRHGYAVRRDDRADRQG